MYSDTYPIARTTNLSHSQHRWAVPQHQQGDQLLQDNEATVLTADEAKTLYGGQLGLEYFPGMQ